jgi:hypothetical protein
LARWKPNSATILASRPELEVPRRPVSPARALSVRLRAELAQPAAVEDERGHGVVAVEVMHNPGIAGTSPPLIGLTASATC